MTTQSHGASALVIPFPHSAPAPICQPRRGGRPPRNVIVLSQRRAQRMSASDQELIRIAQAGDHDMNRIHEWLEQQIIRIHIAASEAAHRVSERTRQAVQEAAQRQQLACKGVSHV